MQLCRRSVVEGDDDDERFADPKWMVWGGGLGTLANADDEDDRRDRPRRHGGAIGAWG
jgi:hypothetical protein